ncbi:unnamed protein product, partial [Musa hybrid cultivar]
CAGRRGIFGPVACYLSNLRSPPPRCPLLNSSNQKCPIPFLNSNETRAATASVLQPSGHTAERGGQHVVPGEGTDDEQHQRLRRRWPTTAPQMMDLLDIVHTAAKILVGGCQVARLRGNLPGLGSRTNGRARAKGANA